MLAGKSNAARKKAPGVGGGPSPSGAAVSVAAVAPGGVHVEAAVESRDGGKVVPAHMKPADAREGLMPEKTGS